MKQSIKEVIEGIKTIVENNIPEIKEVNFMIPTRIGESPADTFPRILLYWEGGATLTEYVNQAPIQIICVDVSRGPDNEEERVLEIQSDCTQYVSKLLDIMQSVDEEYFNGDLNESTTPIESAYADGLSGVECTVNVVFKKPAFNV